MLTQVDHNPTVTVTVEATPVPDLIGAAQAEIGQAEAAGRALAAERRALDERLEGAAVVRGALRREVKRAEDALQDASVRAADAAALAELGHFEDGTASPTASARLDELAQRLSRLMAAAREDKRRREALEAQDRALVEREREAEAHTRDARLGLERARHLQPLHDLLGVLEDTLSGPFTLVDAAMGADGATYWLTDGSIDYVRSSGRTWIVTDVGAYRSAYPALPSGWLVEPRYQRQQVCGRLTVPGDGLLTIEESLAIIRRLVRGDTHIRLRGLHWSTRHPESGLDAYVVIALDGVRLLEIDTFGRAQQVIGGF